MPLYEFYCSDCEEAFTVLCRYEQRSEVKVCARCGGSRIEVALSVFAVGGGPSEASAGGGGGGGCACGGSCSCGN
jgi:putative FmdB family regulatory protein